LLVSVCSHKGTLATAGGCVIVKGYLRLLVTGCSPKGKLAIAGTCVVLMYAHAYCLPYLSSDSI